MSTSEMSTPALGNTNTAAGGWLKGRNFMFTVQESQYGIYEEVKKYLTNLKGFQYWLCCEHHNEDQPHSHVYIQYTDNKRLSLKKLKGLHTEQCKGSAQRCIQYLKCEDDKHIKLGIQATVYEEIGEPLLNGGIKCIKDIKESTKEELEQSLNPMFYNIAEKIKSKQHEEDMFMTMLTEIETDVLKGPEVYYLTGPSGAGKTYGAYKLALSKYDKKDIGKILINNNFFKITNENAKCFVIEEFRPSQLHASDFLQLIDKYGFNCNVKGGFITIRPECFIICSIIQPEELYKNEEINEQFRRRITKIYEINEKRELIERLDIDDIQL